MRKLAILMLIPALALAGCGDKGDGQKNGVLTKLAKTGIICKTWEAELVRGGAFSGGTGVMGAPFDFTIEDPKLLETAQTAFDNQQEVRIHYRTELTSFCRSDSDSHFLTAIEIVPAGQGGTIRDDAPAAPGAPAGTPPGGNLTPDQVDRIINQNQQMLDLLKKKVG